MKTVTRRVFYIVAGLALIVRPAILWAAPNDEPPGAVGVIDDTLRHIDVKEQNGVSFVSGGVGTEEREALQAMKGRFNLELTMATPSGKYIGDTTLRIENPQGKTIVETRTDGPIFMAKLPPGQYTIHASAEGNSMTRTVSAPSGGMEQVTMTWPGMDAPSRAGDVPQTNLPREKVPQGDVPNETMPKHYLPPD